MFEAMLPPLTWLLAGVAASLRDGFCSTTSDLLWSEAHNPMLCEAVAAAVVYTGVRQLQHWGLSIVGFASLQIDCHREHY